MAEINGGKFGEGLTVGAINEILIGQLSKLTKKDAKGDDTPLLSSEQMRWISALVGGVVSETVGGNAGQGGSIADSATRNNWSTHMHNVLLDELKDKLSEEELEQAKSGNKDADALTLLFFSAGHVDSPPSIFYSRIESMLSTGEITFEQAKTAIFTYENKICEAAKVEFIKRLNYAINYQKQGDNKEAAYWVGQFTHLSGDIESHIRLGEGGTLVMHLVSRLGMAPDPDDPKYIESRFERAKINTAKAYSIYDNALKTGVIDMTKVNQIFNLEYLYNENRN